MDIGCGNKPYINLFTNVSIYKGIDFENHSLRKDLGKSKPDRYFAINYLQTLELPYKDEIFDIAVSFQVLEHHNNPHKFLDEIFRITKKGGFIMLTFPLINELHEIPSDYFRFTKYGFLELIKVHDYDLLEVKTMGSVFSTISRILNSYLNEIASKGKLQYIMSALIYPPFLIFQYVALTLDCIFRSNSIFMNYLILLRKK